MYVFYCNNPANNLRAGDCVIRAICKVTGDTWEKVYTELSVEGYGLADWANANHVWDTFLLKKLQDEQMFLLIPQETSLMRMKVMST